MTGARRPAPLCAFGTLLLLGLGLPLGPERSLAAQPGVFDRLTGGDRKLADTARQTTLENWPSGELYMWRNESTGNSGAVMPLRSFKIKTGHFCREYRETMIVQARMESRELTACRSDEGIWITVER